MDLLWARIYDVILKSIISGEHYVLAAIKKNQLHRNNCFEVFGYDILLDSELKPWLLEVNLSPSLACESPLDTTIKANLIAQLTGPVRWTQSVQNMVADGATKFVECGPGKVLQGLVKKIAPETETAGI